LAGLNEDYKLIRGSILMMKPLSNIDQVYSLILQKEKQRSLNAISQLNLSSIAFHSNIKRQDSSIINHTTMATQQQRFYNSQQRSRSGYNVGQNVNA